MFKKTLQYYFAEKIVKKIQSGGESAFLCGGSVRDSLLGLPCKDVDVATSLGPKQVMSLFPGSELVGASFGVVLVKCPMGISVEVATFRTDSKSHSDSRRPDSIRYVSTPEEDCVRRDFSCNALYFNPTTKEIIDFVGGQKDIQNKILRCVGKAKDRFNEDALRILRAIRFVFRLGFTMDSELREAIIELAPNLKNISGERVRDELTAIFKGPNPDQALQCMYDLGILDVILPELIPMWSCDQDNIHHPEGKCSVHTCITLKHISPKDTVHVWGAVLHDCGKPKAKDICGKFINHEDIGAEIASEILTRLCFSNDEKEMIISMVKDHMKFLFIKEMRKSRLRRFMGTPHFENTMDLHKADSLASSKDFDAVSFVQERIKEFEQAGEEVLPKPIINGDQIMERFSLKPGRQIGELLRKIQDLQLEDVITTAEEAFSTIERELARGE